jgi:ParB/RepB/Spo0J family partition protein
MALKLKGMTQGTDYVLLKENYIQIDPSKLKTQEGFNNRRFVDGIEALADTIYNDGQDTPIVVRPVGDELVVVEGHRRLLAALHINRSLLAANEPIFLIKAEVKQMDDEAAIAANLRENLDREDLSPVDIGFAIQNLVNTGKTQAQVALLMRLSPAAVSDYAKLARLPVKLQKLLHENRKLKSSMLEICRLPEEEWQSAFKDFFEGEKSDLPTAREIVSLRRQAAQDAAEATQAASGDPGSNGEASKGLKGVQAPDKVDKRIKPDKVKTMKEIVKMMDLLAQTPEGQERSMGAVVAGAVSQWAQAKMKDKALAKVFASLVRPAAPSVPEPVTE